MATAVGARTREARQRTSRKRKPAEPASRGLGPAQLTSATPPPRVTDLRRAVEQDGGWILGTYQEPVGGHWQVLAALPIEKVAPTPFQRDLSPAHVARLAKVIDEMDRFLDPIVAVRTLHGMYWTPNGHHRTAVLRSIGARAVVALILPEPEVAYQILALNTEKAHNLREKSLEAIRMARAIAEADPSRTEKEFALEFEEASYLTLGACYEQRGRFAGGAYQPVIRRVDGFLAAPLPKALESRAERAHRLLELDDAIARAVEALRERGFENPYLRAFVVARVNPLRFRSAAKATFDETLEKMLVKARRFDAEKVRADQLATLPRPSEET